MAFFDDLGKKLSNAGQTAVQKTQELAAVAKLNSEISDEEKKINNTYFQIGKLYVAMHENDCESDFQGMIISLRDSTQKIAEYKQQIQNIKGVVRCEKCGAEVANNVAFCSSCGAPMPKQSVSVDNGNLVKCSNCGTLVSPNMRFCTSCGKLMSESTQETTAQEKTLESTVEAVKKCPNCGVETNEEIAFCTECGTKLN